MKPKFAFAILGLGVVTWGAIVFAQDTSDETVGLFEYENPAAVERGAAIYAESCASCHGADLEGQENWRTPNSNGRAPAPPHDETGHTWHHPDTQLFQIVKFGTAALVGNGYESDMAGYEGILSDQDIMDTLAYIKSTWPEEIIERHNGINAAAASQ